MAKKTDEPPKQRRGGKLSEADRVEIVTRLAMWDSHKSIVDYLAERGIDFAISSVRHYDPTVTKALAPKWVELFHTTREEFLKNLVEEPIANRAFRLRRLNDLYKIAVKEKDIEEARKALEQAAKEVGNVYTNLSKVSGSLEVTPGLGNVERTEDESRNMLADRLSEALKRLPASQATIDQVKH